jgi:hypothetical protein
LKETEERLVAATKEVSELESRFGGEHERSSNLENRVQLLEEEGNRTRKKFDHSRTQYEGTP